MLSAEKMLLALIALMIAALPGTLLAANHYEQELNPQSHQVQHRSTVASSPLQLADDWDHRHHHWDDDDYNWGGRTRYKHPYSYYDRPTPPPAWNGWNRNQREGFLIERRNAAIRLQRQMRAKGDNRAAERLGTAIQQLNARIARGR
jgi:hypothetical protein